LGWIHPIVRILKKAHAIDDARQPAGEDVEQALT
jgi:hypothetical protein